MGMPMGPPPGAGAPPPGAGAPPPGAGAPPPSGKMVSFDISIPAEVADQVVPILQQLLQKVGGTLAPDTDDSDAEKGARQTAMGARGNRPQGMPPPAPTGGPTM